MHLAFRASSNLAGDRGEPLPGLRETDRRIGNVSRYASVRITIRVSCGGSIRVDPYQEWSVEGLVHWAAPRPEEYMARENERQSVRVGDCTEPRSQTPR